MIQGVLHDVGRTYGTANPRADTAVKVQSQRIASVHSPPVARLQCSSCPVSVFEHISLTAQIKRFCNLIATSCNLPRNEAMSVRPEYRRWLHRSGICLSCLRLRAESGPSWRIVGTGIRVLRTIPRLWLSLTRADCQRMQRAPPARESERLHRN